MTRSVMSTTPGNPHAALGLPAYVQFTSPIRRYTDLLAHYQVCVHLCKEDDASSDGVKWQISSLGNGPLLLC